MQLQYLSVKWTNPSSTKKRTKPQKTKNEGKNKKGKASLNTNFPKSLLRKSSRIKKANSKYTDFVNDDNLERDN